MRVVGCGPNIGVAGADDVEHGLAADDPVAVRALEAQEVRAAGRPS